MKTLIIISTLFVIGSLCGYLLEVFYRRIFSAKRWINPGFLVGPYIPLYGFGIAILYATSNINFNFINQNELVVTILKIVIIGVSMTAIEFIAGVIFIKGMHIKLWDYSDRWGNIKGIICPLFSFIWLIVGSLYFFFINPFLIKAISWISDNLIYTYFIGAVVGAMVVDTCYSLHLGFKIKEATGNLTIKYEQFKIDIKDEYAKKNIRYKFFGSLMAIEKANNSLQDKIKKHVESLPSLSKWWQKNKNR